jgi:hypothetical protein
LRFACESAGQQITVTEGNMQPVTEFRFSARRHNLVFAVMLLALLAAVVAVNLAEGRRWWNMLPFYGLVLVFSVVLARWNKGRGPRLPVRLTDKELQVTGHDGSMLGIDPANIRHVYVHGRWIPYLVVKVVDPSQTRPPLPLWQGAKPGPFRPDEMAIPLAYMTPGRNILRRELSQRFPTAAG